MLGYRRAIFILAFSVYQYSFSLVIYWNLHSWAYVSYCQCRPYSKPMM